MLNSHSSNFAHRFPGHLGLKATKLRLCAQFLLVLVVLVGAARTASAQLARFGPIDSSNGFPTWYQDTTGLALDHCLPQSQAEMTWCLLPPIPSGNPPEVFPTNWSIENFYADATAGGTQQGVAIKLVLDLESSFANGFNVVPGDQVVFARTRVKVSPLPFNGTYTVYTPLGKFVFDNQLAGDRIFFTEDIGLAGVGDFSKALGGRMGPFLLPSATPGGIEVPPIPLLQPGQDPFNDVLAAGGGGTIYPGNGRKYIADPARLGPITGGKTGDGQALYTVNDGTTRDPNIFRVEGPNGFVFETTNFNLMGRVYEGPIAGEVKVDRASYARTASSNTVDVYATASPSTQGRIPAGNPPATGATHLTYFDAPCTATLDNNGNPGPPFTAPANVSSTQMLATGSAYFGESNPAAVPSQVCIQANAVDSAGQTVPTFIPAAIGDQIFITEALYDPRTQSLSVKAASADQTVPQTLSVSGLGSIGANGQLVVNPILAPPASVTVLSTGTGSNTLQVSTGTVNGGTAALPVAVNDSATVYEDCSQTASSTPCVTPLSISVLANDTGAAGGTVAIVSAPVLGTATVNADGSISYMPKLNASGTDSFSYNVTVSGQTSNEASVTVNVTPVNDAPTAVADKTGALAGVQNSVNVLSNDTDPDGAADLAAAVIVNGNAALGIVSGTVFNGGVVIFTPPAQNPPGTYTFTYNAVDQAGTQSASPATVTVTLSGGEALLPAKTIYTQNKGRWTLSGTVSPTNGQTITMVYVDGTYKVNGACTGSAAGTVVGSAPSDGNGNFLFDQILTNTSGVLNPSNTLGNSTGFWCTPPRTIRYSSSLSTATNNQALQLK